jgi:hypothetical protein
MIVNNVLSTTITFQDSARSKILRQIQVGSFLQLIRNENYNVRVTRIRQHRTNGDFDKQSQEKKELPAVTFSGLFYDGRKITCISEYNNICVVDVDHISENNISSVLQCFNFDPFIFSFWISPSGDGVKGLVKFKYNESFELSKSQDYHKQAFSLLAKYMKEKYNIEIDKSGSDITRLCFVSSDSNLVIKHRVEEFEIKGCARISKPVLQLKNDNTQIKKRHSLSKAFVRKDHLFPIGRNKQNHRTQIQKYIKFLKNRNLSITGSYEKWYHIAYAIANSFTYDLGEKYFLKLCRLDGHRHDEEESIKMLQYCYVNSTERISFGTIEHYFKELKEEWGSRTEEASSKIDP